MAYYESTDRKVIFRISAQAHRALRMRVAQDDNTIQDFVEKLLLKALGLGKDASVRREKPIFG